MDFEPLLEINQKNNADTTEKEQEENNSKTKLEQLEDLKREQAEAEEIYTQRMKLGMLNLEFQGGKDGKI